MLTLVCCSKAAYLSLRNTCTKNMWILNWVVHVGNLLMAKAVYLRRVKSVSSVGCWSVLNEVLHYVCRSRCVVGMVKCRLCGQVMEHSSAYGLVLGFLLENGHLENRKGYERVTLGQI